jgi:hypothetical protein
MYSLREFGRGSTSRPWDNEHRVPTGHTDNLYNPPPITLDICEVEFPGGKRSDKGFVPTLLLKPPTGVWYLAAIIQNSLESVMKTSRSFEIGCIAKIKIL